MKDLNLAGFKSHASMSSFADDQLTNQSSVFCTILIGLELVSIKNNITAEDVWRKFVCKHVTYKPRGEGYFLNSRKKLVSVNSAEIL